ncbi:biotin--[acetyl-CoA-carboxylase] ligase [Nonomuraea soli]|uniref:biotin--[biotin carboxyl-carrier protein] ligase n=1 Tax=Nonomuraea soli TaxID=1032476 RepID=A0A7W0HR29_9ACTN|nr:biotin--[acetyl-CoA-carboxylase] ligase [Nonomuraea soli]MBA2892569.1 BirA family biotin operon repressor/biotin-[acetyl-CoA-carboxylase] ligase [Nonomuraea soli]
MSDSRYTDLDRPPLSQAALTRALIRPGGLWTGLTVVDRTASTNSDLMQSARGGSPEGMVLVAEMQFAGKGRLGRTWTAPPRSGLAFSVLLRPRVPAQRQGWLPLLFGVAAASAVRRLAELDVRLKWPNDLLVGDRKLAGILAERSDDAVIVGTGLNVSMRESELPVPTATSLGIELAGRKLDRERTSGLDREPLLREILREVEAHYREWVAAEGDADRSGLRAAYQAVSATIGREIRVELPGERMLTGVATGVDRNGHLEVDDKHTLSAGDVVHVR